MTDATERPDVVAVAPHPDDLKTLCGAQAQSDAERVYGDLTAFQIEMKLEPDGWHVDYLPARPTMKGGGPSYVIDPDTGDIVRKRYEQ